MSRIVRTETRQRGFVGKLMKWSFILFNLYMVYALFSGLAAVGEGYGRNATDMERTAYGAGTAIGLGAILFFWMAVDVILGLFVIFTRGKKTIIEETAP